MFKVKSIIINLSLLATISSCSNFSKKNNPLNVVHWNIKELSSKDLENKDRLKNIRSVLNNLEYNLLSINELQYDLPEIPNYKFQTRGQNAEKLARSLNLNTTSMAISFNQANTGNKAKKFKGTYFNKNTPKASAYIDDQNYGLFPGQYSTALLSYFPIKEEILIHDLKWTEFNKDIKLSKFKTSKNKPIDKDIELFDKSFTDNIIEYDNVEIHIITLHAVPSYHFGNKNTPNYERNRDQLRFLEWYLTGGTDLDISLPKRYAHIKPLKENERFIIMGDLNVSIYNDQPGSKVLRRIFKMAKMWIEKPSHTHENQSFDSKRNPLLLDYIAFRGLKIIDAGIYKPNEDSGPCISFEEIPKRLRPKNSYVKKECYNEELIDLKLASDHFPIWAKFILN